MIALVEGAKRQRTPNEIALVDPAGRPDDRLPAGDGHAAAVRLVRRRRRSAPVALVALLVCLIPTTIGGLLSAIGIAGMDRVARFNVLAMSGRAVEASGDVDVILLDKTGTITYGNRLASRDHARRPACREADGARRRAAWRRSATRRPRAARSSSSRASRLAELGAPAVVRATMPVSPRCAATIAEISPSAPRRGRAASGLTAGASILKGAVDAIERRSRRGDAGGDRSRRPTAIASRGATPAGPPTATARSSALIELKDTVKPGPRRALRGVPPDGHPDRDDHRRQPAHRGDDRQGGRRRRLRRRGQARGQDRLHPRRSRPRATSSR